MKSIITILIVAVSLMSCKQNSSKLENTQPLLTKEYPAEIEAIFEAHGGIDTWNSMNNLCFTIEKEKGNETHTIDLKSRKTRIEGSGFILGFDGKKAWLDQDEIHFKLNSARFYHSLMFYFYAMPFVLGDDGVKFSEAKPIEFEGVSYPGTKIDFEANTGDSPNDEYIIYRDPKTNEMAWLAYTVTYGKRNKNNRFSFIRYDKWIDINGLKLPSEINWYNRDQGVLAEKVSGYSFTKPSITKTILDPSIFRKPERAKFAN